MNHGKDLARNVEHGLFYTGTREGAFSDTLETPHQ
jgi:hypothetical protein